MATMMSAFSGPLLILFAFIYPLRATEIDRPEYVQCQNNSECSQDQCCVIGPMRYSIPQCRPKQLQGEICRPNSAETVNMTLGYPDGAQVKLTDVHYILCPCADGLSCNKGTCEDGDQKRESNHLSEENRKQDDLVLD